MDESKNIEKDQKIEGEVVTYFPEKGYGFIKYGGNIDDAFFHISDVIGGTKLSIFKGLSVEFKFEASSNRATKINILDEKIENDYYYLAKIHKANKNYPIARRYFEEGIKNAPMSKLYDQYALMEKDLENYGSAEEIFKKGLKAYPRDPSLRLNYAFLNWELERLPEAADLFRKFLKIKKDDPKVLFFLGRVLVQPGPDNYIEARKCFENALLLDSNNIQIKQHREILLHLMKKEEDIVKNTLLLFQKTRFGLEWLWEKTGIFVDIEIKTSDNVFNKSFDMEDRILVRVVLDDSNIEKTITDIKRTLEKPISAPFRRINSNIAFLVFNDKKKVYDLLKEIQTTGLSIIQIDHNELKKMLEGDPYNNLLNHVSKYIEQNDLYDKRTPISDVRTFFGRETLLLNLSKRLNKGSHIGIFGLRKIGKTSLLYRLADNFPTDLVAVIDIEYIAIKDCKYIYNEIIKKLIQDVYKKYPQTIFPKEINLLDDTKISISTDEVATLFKSDIDLILKTISNCKILIFLDEADLIAPYENTEKFSGNLDFFRMIRGLSQSSNRVFSIISSPSSDMCTSSKWNGNDNPIFQMYSEDYIGNFPQNELNEMVVEIGKKMALTFNKESLETIFNYSGGHPYITRQLCSVIATQNTIRPLTVTKDIVKGASKGFFKKKIAIINEILDRIGEGSLQILKVISGNNNISEENISKSLSKLETKVHLYNLEKYKIVEEKDGLYKISIELLNLWIKINWVE